MPLSAMGHTDSCLTIDLAAIIELNLVRHVRPVGKGALRVPVSDHAARLPTLISLALHPRADRESQVVFLLLFLVLLLSLVGGAALRVPRVSDPGPFG